MGALLGLSDEVTIAGLSTFGVIVVGYFGYLGAKRSGEARRAASAAADAVDTGNEKTVGSYVHDMARTQEIILIQTRGTAGAVVELAQRVERHAHRLDQHIQEEAESRRAHQAEVLEVVRQLGTEAKQREQREEEGA